jgi:hypothetical protein
VAVILACELAGRVLLRPCRVRSRWPMVVALECRCRRGNLVVRLGISMNFLATAFGNELVTGDPIVAIANSTICF